MGRVALAMLAACVAVGCLPALPDGRGCLGLLPAGLALLPARRWRPAGVGLIAVCWAVLVAHSRLADRLDASLSGQDRVVTGVIVAPVWHDPDRLRVLLRVSEADRADGVPSLVRLNWYRARVLPGGGETWRLTVRLRRPRGLANPGGFDYERWLFRAGIGATGYVRRDPGNRRLAPAEPGVTAMRQRLVDGFRDALTSPRAAGLAVALSTGIRDGLPAEVRGILAATGTSHLVAISGLHVGMVAGLGFALGGLLWRLLPGRWRPASRLSMGLPAALALAVAYAALAGFTTPTRRALVMLAVALVSLGLRRVVRPTHGLAVALAAVLAMDPMSPLDPGFWMSFLAVAALLWAGGGGGGGREGTGLRSRTRWLVRAQLAISLVISVPVAVLGAGIAWGGPLVNLLAIPLFGLLVVPAVLLAAVLLLVLPRAGFVESVLGPLLGGVLHGLAGAADWLAPLPLQSPGVLAAALALAGAALMIAPAAGWSRWLGATLLLPLLARPPDALPRGTFELVLLDVGQGLAAVVRTRRHWLVYDTGPAWRGGSAAERVVIPFVADRAGRAPDGVVVSHGDGDHAGGLEAMRDAWPLVPVLRGGDVPPPGITCRDGQAWTWDDVRFSMVHPSPGGPMVGNDGSCVLLVAGQGGTVLLPGDIEEAAEHHLLARYPQIAADVVVVPHHGSRTSSGPALVHAIEPRWALVPAGYGNRWGFPVPEVVDRWRRVGARVLVTGDCGALTVTIGSGRGDISVSAWRGTARRFWHDDTARERCGPVGLLP